MPGKDEFSKIRKAKKEFGKKFADGKAGRIENGDGTPVVLGPVGRSGVALLVYYTPAPDDKKTKRLLTFPRQFKGFPVQYSPGFDIVARKKKKPSA